MKHLSAAGVLALCVATAGVAVAHSPELQGLETEAAAVTASTESAVESGAPTNADQAPPPTQNRERQDDAADLDKMVVTGARAGTAVDKIPGAVIIVSQQEIETNLLLSDDTTRILGQTLPGFSEPSQQMYSPAETLRGRKALMLFDGVPQSSPLREGSRTGIFTDMGVVGRIEVIQGPSAAEGIGASGGIINFISKAPREGTHVNVTTRYSTQFKDGSGGWKVGSTIGHKEDAYDLLVSFAKIDRGLDWDGRGRSIGRSSAGALSDSDTNNLYMKLGTDFGASGQQRLQFSLSNFRVVGKGNYITQDGNKPAGIPHTSVRGEPLGSKTEFNHFRQFVASYENRDLFGGFFKINAYRASQAMRFVAESGSDKQDPDIAPLGELVDQSEINSQKHGVRTSWTRGQLFGVDGLELRAGVDVVKDTTDQHLALTHRLWVPPMRYTSTAPYAQVSWDSGPLTVSGGLRREDGKLHVNDYTTSWYNNRVFVKGGDLTYKANMPNIGMIVRLPQDWSVYGSFSEGFSLPNVGIPLRNINTPGQQVSGILDLQALIVKNKEVGFNWQGDRIDLGVALYESTSKLGVSITVDPILDDFVMNRVPTRMRGVELTGTAQLTDTLSLKGLYSRIRGKTERVKGGPLEKDLGVADVSPDKLVAALNWNFLDRGRLSFIGTRMFSRSLNIGEKTTGYTLFDLTASYPVGTGALSLGLENIFDKYYIPAWGQAGSTGKYLAGRGRVTVLTYAFDL